MNGRRPAMRKQKQVLPLPLPLSFSFSLARLRSRRGQATRCVLEEREEKTEPPRLLGKVVSIEQEIRACRRFPSNFFFFLFDEKWGKSLSIPWRKEK